MGRLQDLHRAKETQHLLVVLSSPETATIIDQLSGVKKLVVSLLYGSGLWLRVQDIDSSYSQIWVRDSKGAKDRVSILPEILHDDLKQHLRKVKNLHRKDLARGWGSWSYLML